MTEILDLRVKLKSPHKNNHLDEFLTLELAIFNYSYMFLSRIGKKVMWEIVNIRDDYAWKRSVFFDVFFIYPRNIYQTRELYVLMLWSPSFELLTTPLYDLDSIWSHPVTARPKQHDIAHNPTATKIEAKSLTKMPNISMFWC